MVKLVTIICPKWAERGYFMNCKHCQQELETGVTLCPNCGADNTPEQQAPKADNTPEKADPKADKTKFWLTVAAIAAVALLGIGLIMITLFGIKGGWDKNDGKQLTATTGTTTEPAPTTTPVPTEYVPGEGVLLKQSYSMESFDGNPELKDLVVAKVGDKTLTNVQLQMYYWMQFYEVWNYYYSQYSYYTPYYIGLDYTQPFADQYIPDGSMNWEQYLVHLGVNTWHRYLVLGMMAEEAGYSLPEESRTELENVRTSMEATAQEKGLASADALLEQEMGDGVTLDQYMEYMELYYLGEEYFSQVYDSVAYTDADLEAYYTANTEALTASGITKDAGNVGDVRHILIMPEGGTEVEGSNYKQYTDEEWAACLVEAQAVLDEWKAGEATEDSFHALTGKYTQDTGYVQNEGLYTDVYTGSGYVSEFEAWIVDPARKSGDCEIVKTSYGYHIMYLVDAEPMWQRYCRQAYLSEYCTKLIDEQVANHPLEVDYEKVAICNVSLN